MLSYIYILKHHHCTPSSLTSSTAFRADTRQNKQQDGVSRHPCVSRTRTSHYRFMRIINNGRTRTRGRVLLSLMIIKTILMWPVTLPTLCHWLGRSLVRPLNSKRVEEENSLVKYFCIPPWYVGCIVCVWIKEGIFYRHYG